MNMKILLTGGGTGGHLIPLLSVIEEIRRREPEAEFLFVGPKSEFNETLREKGIKVREIQSGKLRRYFSLKNLTDILGFLVGTDEALWRIIKFGPDVIFSKGGYASVPAVLAASYIGVPVLTHESDTVPGLANKLIGRCAKKIFISFPKTREYFPKDKIIMSGNPIRQDIKEGNKERAKAYFGLSEDLPTLLVFGGSQGARNINRLIVDSLGDILERYQVIHVCGTNNYDQLKEEIGKLTIGHRQQQRYKIYPYLGEEMKDAYALADGVVSRAGASSLSEIVALEKPSLIIPLPSAANNHQYLNAKYFRDEGMVLMVEEKELDKDTFTQKLEELASKKSELTDKLEAYGAQLGARKPEEIIAEEILKYGKS